MQFHQILFKLAIVMTIFLTSCNKGDDSSDNSGDSNNESSETLSDSPDHQPNKTDGNGSENIDNEKDNASKKSAESTSEQTEDILKPEVNIPVESIFDEGDEAFVEVTLSIPSKIKIDISFDVIDESAVDGKDYHISSRLLEFHPGETTKKINISIFHDQIYEPGDPELFRIELKNSDQAIVANNLAIIKITDQNYEPYVYFSNKDVNANESDGSVKIEVEVSEVSTIDRKVNFLIKDGEANSVEDFIVPASDTLVIPAGQKSNFIDITIKDDDKNELDEKFYIELVNPDLAEGYSPESATVTISENDDSTSYEVLKTFSEQMKPKHLISDGSVTYFSAGDGINGRELWITDGTPEGTKMVKNINPGGDSNPSSLTLVSSVLYFSADDGIHGRELWKSDGTEVGTQMIADINRNGDSSPEQIIEFNSNVYFTVNYPTIGEFEPTTTGQLWKLVDNQPQLVQGFSRLNDRSYTIKSTLKYLTVVDTKLSLFVHTGNFTVEYWQTDGTSEGTQKIDEFRSFSKTPLSEPKVIGSTLFFNLNAKLWKHSIDEPAVNEINSRTYAYEVLGNYLFYIYNNALWKTDGTGSQNPLIPEVFGFHQVHGALGDNLLFSTEEIGDYSKSSLWRINNSSSEKFIVKSPIPKISWSQKISMNELYFITQGNSNNQFKYALWKTDGTTAGTLLLKKLGYVFNNEQTNVAKIGNSLIYNFGSDLIKLK